MEPVVIPSVGHGMSEALLLRWLREVGDTVAEGDAVAEIETDKATMELVSPVAGVLGRRLAAVDDIVPVGAPIAYVLEPGETEPEEAPVVDEPVAEAPQPVSAAAGAGPPVAAARPERHRLSPRARAAQAAAAAAETSQAASPSGDGRYRELIAARVSESWATIPHFTVARELEVEPMFAAVERARADGIDVSVTDLLLRALALAWKEVRGDARASLGLAVATDHGVVIPVIRTVAELDLASLHTARVEAVERARERRLVPEDLEGNPVATLSNLGSFGVDWFTAVIPTGQTAILAVGRARPRPVVGPEGGVTVRSTCYASLAVDHRVLDGADAARLLAALADAAEDEQRLLDSGGEL